MTDNVLVTDDGAIRTIRMNRPEKKNALTRAMYDGITRALHEADSNDAIRCVLLAGAPGVFCAGNDISDFLNASEGDSTRAAIVFSRRWPAAKNRWSPRSAGLPSGSA